MQPDPEYLRRHFSSLSDEALLAVDRDDLVATAQQLYDAEVNSRDLAPSSNVRQAPRRSEDRSDGEEEAEGDPSDEGDTPDWLDEATEVYSVTVNRGSPVTDAATDAMGVLEAAGIPCHLESVETPEENVPAAHRWRLMVPGNFNMQATSTLERDMFNQEFETGWRTYLEVLSDDELLAASPETVLCGLFDRMERVTKAYEEEIARRRL